MVDWPSWWDWELELSSHLLKRMGDRGFTEIDLRLMMERAQSLKEDVEQGRWIVKSTHESKDWEVVVEPDSQDETIVVITAYPLDDA
jgi:hypothetical protein